MPTVQISPWHLCRQQAFAVRRSVIQIGQREIARRAKIGHMRVQRFCADPTSKPTMDFYLIAAAAGFTIALKLDVARARDTA